MSSCFATPASFVKIPSEFPMKQSKPPQQILLPGLKLVASIFIPGEFTTLNEYISVERSNKFYGAKTKKDETNAVALMSREFPQITTYPVFVKFAWYRRNAKTDPDNVDFTRKFVLDGLVKGGVLAGDSCKFIMGLSALVLVDKNNPGIDIEFWA